MSHPRKPMPGALINWSHHLAFGLVGCWLFREGTGPSVDDDIGYKEGTLFDNARWTDGPFGGPAVAFDGANDGITLTSSINLSSNGFTLVSWVKPNGTGANDNFMGDWNGSGWIFRQDVTDGTALEFYNGTANYTSATGLLVVGAWQQIGVTWDSRTYTLYHNGRPVASGASTTAPTNGSATYFGRIVAAGFEWPGTMDHVLQYGRGLSGPEMAHLAADPYAFLRQPKRLSYSLPATGNVFQPAWVAGSNRILGGGVC